MKFFEAFDMISVEDGLKSVFEEVVATKVAASKLTGDITVHIESARPLPYREKKKMLYQLKKQLFFAPGTVYFHETCRLSAQYNQENLWEACAESFTEELAETSTVLAGIMRSAKISFSGSHLMLLLPDSFINREKSVSIRRFLEQLYKERFDLALTVTFDYTPIPKEEKREEYEFVPVPERLRAVLMAGKEKGEAIGGKPVGWKAEKNSTAVESTKKAGAGKVFDAMPLPVLPQEMSAVSSGNGKTEKPKDQKFEARTPQKDAWQGKFSSGAYQKGRFGKKEIPSDPTIFYGRSFDGDAIPIVEVQDEIGDVVLNGRILKIDVRELKNEKLLYIFAFTDFTDTIQAKLFVRAEQREQLSEKLKEGAFIKLKGMAMLDKYDHEISISSIVGIKEIPSFIQKRKDTASIKRVELHAHTTLSDMDGYPQWYNPQKVPDPWHF